MSASYLEPSIEPMNWQFRPLSECIEKVDVPKKVQAKSFLDHGSVPIVSQEAGLINGYWDDERDAVRVDSPVVIFGDHTQVLKLVDFDFVVGADGVKVLKPKAFLNASFLKYFLEANPVPSLGYARHFRHVSGLLVPTPPLDEQKRIVAALDQAFAALDRVRANIEESSAEATGLGDAWLNGVFQNDSDWPTRQLGELCENLDRQRVPITKADREPGDVPYYGASGIVDYVKNFLFDEELLLVSEDGANLLARTYPIAFSIRGKAWVNNHAHVLRFSNRTTQEFVRLYLNSISLSPFVTGMAQPKLNQGALNSLPVPLPPLDVQESIVARAGELDATSTQAVALYKSQLDDIDALRQSLLQAAFSGELS